MSQTQTRRSRRSQRSTVRTSSVPTIRTNIVTPERIYEHPTLNRAGNSTNSLFRRVSTYVNELRNLTQSPLATTLFSTGTTRNQESGISNLDSGQNQNSSNPNPDQAPAQAPPVPPPQPPNANPPPNPPPDPAPEPDPEPDPDPDPEQDPSNNDDNSSHHSSEPQGSTRSTTSRSSSDNPDEDPDFIDFLVNIANISMETLAILRDAGLTDAISLHWMTVDDLRELGIGLVDRRNLLQIQSFYIQHMRLPTDSAYKTNTFRSTPVSPTIEERAQPSPGYSPFGYDDGADSAASAAVVSLPFAKLMTIPRMPPDITKYLPWREKALTVLGHNGWLPLVQGEEPLTTQKELWLNNQIYYQLKDATKDTDASYIIRQHGPMNVYTDSVGDGREAWKSLIIWMEHPQRLLLISNIIE